MSQVNKIERYNLDGEALALFRAGGDTRSIAAALSKLLADRGSNDSVSQATVSRWLKPVRDEVREEAGQIVTEHIKASLPSDLAAMDEIEVFHLERFRDPTLAAKERSDFGMKALKVVETKLRFALGGDNVTETGISADELAALINRAPKGTDGQQP